MFIDTNNSGLCLIKPSIVLNVPKDDSNATTTKETDKYSVQYASAFS